MSTDELPSADVYLLQVQGVDAKRTGRWRNHLYTSSRQYARDWLDRCEPDEARTAVPLDAMPEGSVTVSGTTHDFPAYEDYRAEAL